MEQPDCTSCPLPSDQVG